jgi:hypothetical protein
MVVHLWRYEAAVQAAAGLSTLAGLVDETADLLKA